MIAYLKTNWKIVLIVTLLFISLLFGYKLIKSNGRLIIYNDSIQVLTNKSGELYSRVNYYQISEKELKQVNSDLYKEVNKLKDKPLTIETVTSSATIKNIKLNVKGDSMSKDSVYSKGNSISILIKDDTLKSLRMNTKLYLSTTERNGKLSINARSDFPNLVFTDIEGYNLNPMPTKPKRFGIGAIVGVNYNGKLTVGIGVSYNIIRF